MNRVEPSLNFVESNWTDFFRTAQH